MSLDKYITETTTKKEKLSVLLKKYKEIIKEVKLSPTRLHERTGLVYHTCCHLCDLMIDEVRREKYSRQLDAIKEADKKIWEMLEKYHVMKPSLEKQKLGDKITRDAALVANMGFKEVKVSYS